MTGLSGASSKTPTQHQQVQLASSPAENTPQPTRPSTDSYDEILNVHDWLVCFSTFKDWQQQEPIEFECGLWRSVSLAWPSKRPAPFTERVACLESWIWLGASLSVFFLSVNIWLNFYFLLCANALVSVKTFTMQWRKRNEHMITRLVSFMIRWIKKKKSEWFIDS